jgi:pantetheine-phosphate adenylyltransferase
MKKALFPGTFDPFTLGHKDIVDRALKSVADEVVIAVGHNRDKHCRQTVEQRLESIRRLYEGNSRVKVIAYEGLTTDTARQVGADFLLRGVRSLKDFEYERDIAETNRLLSGIETVLLYTEPRLSHISSSIVRELEYYGHDASAFLPKIQ